MTISSEATTIVKAEMQFLPQKRRSTPSVIIVSLVDVLMVVLIFLVVSTTFKEAQAYIEIASSDSPDGIQGANSKSVVITIPRDSEHIMLDGKKLLIEKLRLELIKRFSDDSGLILAIEADGKADFEIVVRVRDIAKSVGIKKLNAFVHDKPKP